MSKLPPHITVASLMGKIKEVMGNLDRDTMAKACGRFRTRLRRRWRETAIFLLEWYMTFIDHKGFNLHPFSPAPAPTWNITVFFAQFEYKCMESCRGKKDKTVIVTQ
jgi:hypothetical protein